MIIFKMIYLLVWEYILIINVNKISQSVFKLVN